MKGVRQDTESYNLVPKRRENGSATQTMPPKVLPRVTGKRLSKRKADHVTLAPAKMPAGMMNMFATECSRPNVTKAEIGSQIATAFPVASFAIDARYTAMHTSQLQRIPRTKAVAKGSDVFAIARATVAPPCGMVPEKMANLAKLTAPMKFPSHDKVKDFKSCWGSALFSSTAMLTMAAFPVKSSAPERTVMNSPKGRPKAPKINFWRPGLVCTSCGQGA
mmetsp:Transcript_16040/g.17512  ORF Transcript_16040/g.17512 Transcript_16040/m.17512 type:complete len:220 (+) Transcript_16040:45-704(+)